MKKMIFAGALALVCFSTGMAQEKKLAPPPPPPPKVEKAKFTPPVIKKDVKKPVKTVAPPAPVKKD